MSSGCCHSKNNVKIQVFLYVNISLRMVTLPQKTGISVYVHINVIVTY